MSRTLLRIGWIRRRSTLIAPKTPITILNLTDNPELTEEHPRRDQMTGKHSLMRFKRSKHRYNWRSIKWIVIIKRSPRLSRRPSSSPKWSSPAESTRADPLPEETRRRRRLWVKTHLIIIVTLETSKWTFWEIGNRSKDPQLWSAWRSPSDLAPWINLKKLRCFRDYFAALQVKVKFTKCLNRKKTKIKRQRKARKMTNQRTDRVEMIIACI